MKHTHTHTHRINKQVNHLFLIFALNLTSTYSVQMFSFFELQEFKAVAEKIRNLAKTPTNDEYAEMYSLYKQATSGDCDRSKYRATLSGDVYTSLSCGGNSVVGHGRSLGRGSSPGGSTPER